jgi:hypothetical protein
MPPQSLTFAGREAVLGLPDPGRFGAFGLAT